MEEIELQAEIRAWADAERGMTKAAIGDLVAMAQERMNPMTKAGDLCNEPDCLLCGGVRTMRAMAAVNVGIGEPVRVVTAIYCPSCGARREVEGLTRCVHCGADNAVAWKGVPAVGSLLAPHPAAVLNMGCPVCAAHTGHDGMRRCTVCGTDNKARWDAGWANSIAPTPAESLSFDNLLSPTWKAPEVEVKPMNAITAATDGQEVKIERAGNVVHVSGRGDQFHIQMTHIAGRSVAMALTLPEAEALLVVLKSFVRGKR